MPTLDKMLRSQLENDIKKARGIAETAAHAALEQLGVGEAVPFEYLSEEERALRRKLRAHGRQLGDPLHSDKVQALDLLIEEVAYEHWHRMLFARFLAENNLLMYPDPDEPVSITLEECDELAADEGATNGWELAARFASRMLPQIFRPDSPVFQLMLPPEHQQQLEQLVAGLPQEIFRASDSLGWVYQYWQADNKERINKSGIKIDVRELPAVTQLFTEPYMVSFLLDNTLGAWWAAKRLSEHDLCNAASEEDLRQKAAIPGVPLTYLRFIRLETGAWTPAAGTFAAWPGNVSQLKLLDPCCGSGHFLAAALHMLVAMRMEEEALSLHDAVHAVLRENLYGLELDQRCVKLAAFALAVAAWTYRRDSGSEALGYCALPELNVACSGLPVTEEGGTETLLSQKADYGKGSTTGDAPRFLQYIWEVPHIQAHHVLWLNSPNGNEPWSGRRQYCTTDLNSSVLKSQLGCWLRGQSVWNRSGVAVNKMCNLEPFLYMGEVFDDNICPICPLSTSERTALWCYVSSDEYSQNVREVDQALKVTAATLTKVPFDLERWQKVADENYPHGLPRPYSDDPTQWIFHGHPCGSVIWDESAKRTADGPLRTDADVLQVAVARLLGYRWPAELDTGMELADEQRDWVKRCDALLSFADADGIVCLPPVRGEAAASERLLNLLAAAYGDAWSNDTLAALLADAGHAGKTLGTWLREKFFAQHCKLFQNRPFIWHIWDGLRDGFAALVNYHKLDHKNLETLIYTYLGDWILRQKQDLDSGIDGAQERLDAAEVLKRRLELILAGEAPYDIFVRWKPLDQQPLGWEPDLDDGVRLNIRPFLSVPDVGKKGAGILRAKPNINWNKDRGKDVEASPWYHLFKGDRINDHHLTLAEKQAAREAAE